MSAAPRPARWLLLRLISAGVLVLGIMTALGSLPWRGARFPGFLVMPNRVVPSAGLPSWSGVSDGQPPYQEVLLAVDDTPVTSAADAYRRAAAHRVGEPARYTFARDGVLETHTYPLRQLTDAEYFAIFGAYFIAGLAHLLLAWCAAERWREDPMCRGLAIFGWAGAVFAFTAMDLYGPGRLGRPGARLWFRARAGDRVSTLPRRSACVQYRPQLCAGDWKRPGARLHWARGAFVDGSARRARRGGRPPSAPGCSPRADHAGIALRALRRFRWQ